MRWEKAIAAESDPSLASIATLGRANNGCKARTQIRLVGNIENIEKETETEKEPRKWETTTALEMALKKKQRKKKSILGNEKKNNGKISKFVNI